MSNYDRLSSPSISTRMFLVSSPSEGQDPLISTGHGCSDSELGSICGNVCILLYYMQVIPVKFSWWIAMLLLSFWNLRLVDHGISLDLHSFLVGNYPHGLNRPPWFVVISSHPLKEASQFSDVFVLSCIVRCISG